MVTGDHPLTAEAIARKVWSLRALTVCVCTHAPCHFSVDVCYRFGGICLCFILKP